MDIAYSGQMLIPRNSILVGHVTAISSKQDAEALSALTIIFDHAILKNGQSVAFNAIIRALEGPPDANVFSGGPASPAGHDLSIGGRTATITEGTGNIEDQAMSCLATREKRTAPSMRYPAEKTYGLSTAPSHRLKTA